VVRSRWRTGALGPRREGTTGLAHRERSAGRPSTWVKLLLPSRGAHRVMIRRARLFFSSHCRLLSDLVTNFHSAHCPAGRAVRTDNAQLVPLAAENRALSSQVRALARSGDDRSDRTEENGLIIPGQAPYRPPGATVPLPRHPTPSLTIRSRPPISCRAMRSSVRALEPLKQSRTKPAFWHRVPQLGVLHSLF